MSSNYSSTSSATMMNFLQMSSIPCAANPNRDATGKCITNVDGVCISGGTKIAGNGGYELASMGYPAATCASAGLFTAGNQRYSLNGWAVGTNANTFRMSRPLL